jgi:DNA repair protein RecO (recombination protein O)
MASEKATGIVIRVIDFSETSCIVSIFTREFGKIHGLAKGGRRLKGPFESALDLLALVRLVFIRKSASALDLLTEAKLERRFRGRDHDLASIHAGYYVAELLSELTDDHDPHPDLFDLASETLVELCASGNLRVRILRFELAALNLLGHMPTLTICAECGRPIEVTGRVSFSQPSGGVLCRRCRPGRKQVISLSAGAIRALERFADVNSESWRRVELDSRTHGEMRGMMNHYLAHLIGRPPRMHRYLGTLTA